MSRTLLIQKKTYCFHNRKRSWQPGEPNVAYLREFRQVTREFRAETAKNFDRTDGKLKRLEERISTGATRRR
jgi:hypothetical protein